LPEASGDLADLGPYWPLTLQRVLQREAAVLITVVEVRGSAPRAAGSKMLITRARQFGSIGGGNLEYEATLTAHELLGRDVSAATRENRLYGLGPALKQCCGGAVTLLFETLTNGGAPWLQELCARDPQLPAAHLLSRLDGQIVSKMLAPSEENDTQELPPGFMQALLEPELELPRLLSMESGSFFLEQVEHEQLPLVLFGAGHVARALVPLLASLPFAIEWIDSRAEQFPATVPANVNIRVRATPPDEVTRFAPNTRFLVMTHNHELDEEICYRVLARGDSAWLGLIGSESKRKRFEHRLRKRGLPEASLEALVCPVGMSGISGKRPATIALAIAAQLLRDQVPENWR